MKRFGRTFLAVLLLTFWAGADSPNTRQLLDGQKPAPARIEDFNWLEGRWLGSGFGDLSEEQWQPARNGSMLGLFRQHRNGQPMFYEFLLLTQIDETVELRLKHFNPDLTGWEEKDTFLTFRLIEVKPDEAWFHGLTFRREGDQLSIFLRMRHQDKTQEAVFSLVRQ